MEYLDPRWRNDWLPVVRYFLLRKPLFIDKRVIVKISMIAALTADRVIGADNVMPWHLPADLQHFKSVTLGKPVVMGRRTFESIGRPLPGRLNIVLTRDPTWQAPGVLVAHSPAHALAQAGDVDEVMIIGGGKIYQDFLPDAQCLYLTYVENGPQGDTHFPDYKQFAQQHHFEWQTKSEASHPADEKNQYSLRFLTLERVDKA